MSCLIMVTLHIFQSKLSIILTGLFATIIALFAPIATLYHIMAVGVGLNFIADYANHWKCNKRSALYWHSTKVALERIFFYLGLISMAFLIEKFIIGAFIGTPTKYMTTIVTGKFALNEMKIFATTGSKMVHDSIFRKVFKFFEKKV